MSERDDRALDDALAQLPIVQPPASDRAAILHRVAQLHVAQRVPASLLARFEPTLLVVLATLHLGWALARVFVLR